MRSGAAWKMLAYWICAANTLCILALIDLLVFGKPTTTLFLLIFFLMVYSNFRIFHK